MPEPLSEAQRAALKVLAETDVTSGFRGWVRVDNDQRLKGWRLQVIHALVDRQLAAVCLGRTPILWCSTAAGRARLAAEEASGG